MVLVHSIISGEKEAQYKLAAKLNEIIPDTAKVALYSNEEQYYLANLKSCDLKKYSYAFITYLSDDKIYEKADYVIFDRIHIPDTNRLREVYDIHFFKDVEKEVFIYKKSANSKMNRFSKYKFISPQSKQPLAWIDEVQLKNSDAPF